MLLVLDAVDVLFEQGGGEARDSLVDVLSDLCYYSGQLRLLLTSEQSVLRETNRRIQNGSEKVSGYMSCAV